AATEVFWKLGYTGTAISDLVAATGLHRRSMYDEFGGKDGLFLACVEHFAATHGSAFIASLEADPLGLDNIRTFFAERVDYACAGDCRGCFVVNSAIESNLLDPAISARVNQLLNGSVEPFARNLRAAQERGELKPDANCQELARFLLTLQQGMMVSCKAEPQRAELQATVDLGLRVLAA
ncbi:MAG: TetR/AcrR family transcriptional regulator, partial [Planctomycetota bacterium]